MIKGAHPLHSLAVKKESRESGDGKLTTVLVIFGFTFAAININQYLYGIDNHAIVIPFLKKFLNPDLYPNDYLVEQRVYFYTFFWNALGWLTHHLSIKITVLFFIAHFTSLYFTFLAVYYLASLLFKHADVALLALFFLLFSKHLPGGDSTIYRILDTAIVARPILLFSFYYFLKERFLSSYLLQGIAFLIHPLSAVYMIAVIGLLSVGNLKQIGIKKFGACLGALILLMAPALIWKLTYSPPELNLFSIDRFWTELLRLRSSHHLFPFSWGKEVIIQTVLFLSVFWVSWKHPPEARHHRLIVASSAIILFLWVIATVFSEYLPVAIVLQLQLFRSAYFLYIFAVLYSANYVYRQLKPNRSIAAQATAILLPAALLYHARVWQIALGAFCLFVIGGIIYRFFYHQNFRNTYFRFSLTVLTLVLGIGAFLMREGISIENAQGTDWRAVQQWTKQNSAFDDLFIVPPLLKTEGFRVESERTIYGDWKDGTQMFFNPSFGYEWYERMERLGYIPPDSPEFDHDVIDTGLKKGYNLLTADDFISLARQMGKDAGNVFVVHFRSQSFPEFPKVYQNDQFVVFKVLTERIENLHD